MRVALTGTPGTGKTTVASTVKTELSIVSLADVIDEGNIGKSSDPVRDTSIVDIDQLAAELTDCDDTLFESHLSHHLDVDFVIVLRCHPDELATRLRKRGVSERSIEENVESEALDIILAEAVARHGEDAVYEVDTTGTAVRSVAQTVEAILAGTCSPRVGIVDFSETLQ